MRARFYLPVVFTLTFFAHDASFAARGPTQSRRTSETRKTRTRRPAKVGSIVKGVLTSRIFKLDRVSSKVELKSTEKFITVEAPLGTVLSKQRKGQPGTWMVGHFKELPFKTQGDKQVYQLAVGTYMSHQTGVFQVLAMKG